MELKGKMGQFLCSLCCLGAPGLEAPEQRAVTLWTWCLQFKEGLRDITDTGKAKGKYKISKENIKYPRKTSDSANANDSSEKHGC